MRNRHGRNDYGSDRWETSDDTGNRRPGAYGDYYGGGGYESRDRYSNRPDQSGYESERSYGGSSSYDDDRFTSPDPRNTERSFDSGSRNYGDSFGRSSQRGYGADETYGSYGGMGSGRNRGFGSGRNDGRTYGSGSGTEYGSPRNYGSNFGSAGSRSSHTNDSLNRDYGWQS